MMQGDVNTSKADQIYTWLLEEFNAARIPIGGRLPSENELCEHFMVSRPQVRLAIARLVHEGLVETLRGKGSFRLPLKAKGNRDIAVVLPRLDSYVYPELVVAAGAAIRNRGYQALFDCSNKDPAMEGEILSRLAERQPAGILISPVQTEQDVPTGSLALLRSIRAQGIMVMLIDNTLGDASFSSLVMDDFGAGRKAAEFLLSRGHGHPLVAWRINHVPYNVRAQGFLSVLEERYGREGLGTRELWVSQEADKGTVWVAGLMKGPMVPSAAFLKGELRQALEAYVRKVPKPTAFFCAGDELAFILREAAHYAALEIPKDISIIGFDDSPLARLPEISLSSFTYPSAFLGRRAAELLIHSIESGPPAVRISMAVEPMLMERSTVADYRTP